MLNVLLFSCIVALFLLPFAFVVIGIIRRRKDNGIIFFMLGTGFIIVYILSELSIPAIINALLFLFFLWLSYHLFIFIQEWGTREFQNHAGYLIRLMQDPALPSCEDLLMKYVKKNLLRSPSLSKSQDTARAAEILVYNIACDLVDTPVCRYPAGTLTPTGDQLLHICRRCLDLF